MAKKVTGTTRRKRSVKPAHASLEIGRVEVPGDAVKGGHGALPPGCPPMNPMQGDKTPAVVAWLREYAPTEFGRRYKGRKVKF